MYWVLMLGHQQSVEMDPGRESNGRHTLFLSSYVVEAMILLHQISVSSLPPNEKYSNFPSLSTNTMTHTYTSPKMAVFKMATTPKSLY